MALRYTLTVRDGPRVLRTVHATLPEALESLEARVAELESTVHRETVDLHVRRFEPVDQVAARAEVTGPLKLRRNLRAGVDIRGDGSAEAYIGGRINREVLEQVSRETPVAALRRELDARGFA